jgi:hypothetical protein
MIITAFAASSSAHLASRTARVSPAPAAGTLGFRWAGRILIAGASIQRLAIQAKTPVASKKAAAWTGEPTILLLLASFVVGPFLLRLRIPAHGQRRSDDHAQPGPAGVRVSCGSSPQEEACLHWLAV